MRNDRGLSLGSISDFDFDKAPRSHDPHQATKRKKEEEEEGGKGKGKVCVLWGGNSPRNIWSTANLRTFKNPFVNY